MNSHKTIKRIVIIGAGFGGLTAAKRLCRVDNFEVDLIDRNNYHLFQPLLYQVATSALSPADIAYPIRSIFRKNRNVQVFLSNVTAISLEKRNVEFEYGSLSYDYLIVSTGAKQSYFGNEDWMTDAPGLKGIDDALEIRRRVLLAFESAEYEADPAARAVRLTFVVVGGGPTGVELAGAIKEIAVDTIRADFRNVDTSATRVVLVEGNDRLLKGMHPESSQRAKEHLESIGVEVLLSARVTDVNSSGVQIGEYFIRSNNVFWAAGVQASSLLSKSGINCDRAGRALVNKDFSIPGYPEVFVIGDAANLVDSKSGLAVPGVAQGAIQAAEFVAEIIKREEENLRAGIISNSPRPNFHYHDRGSMATIGRALAVAEIGPFKFGGFLAWLIWSFIHVLVLVGFRNRISVLLSWFWNYLMFSRGARLITGKSAIKLKNFKESFKPGKSQVGV